MGERNKAPAAILRYVLEAQHAQTHCFEENPARARRGRGARGGRGRLLRIGRHRRNQRRQHAGTQAGTKAPLVIGISLSLTGDFGDTGKAAEKGYELWASQVNKSGGILGRQVQLKIVDDTTSATQVVTNYESLINKTTSTWSSARSPRC